MDVSEIARSLHGFGERYARRVFTEDELGPWRRGGTTAVTTADLAERFAAKEAALKVLAPGETGLDWRSVEVRRHPGTGPALSLAGTAADLARAAGIGHISLSVSSAGGLAMAVAVAATGLSAGPGTTNVGTVVPEREPA